MKFGRVSLTEAEGAILAHSVQAGGRRLRKGLHLGGAEVAALRAEGHVEVMAARLEPGDLHEDAAADRLARALAPGTGMHLTTAATGRVNVIAEGPGLARIDAAKIGAANAVDPMLTVATVPEWHRMDARGMVATVKIIAYGVPEAAVAQAAEAGAGAIAMVAPRLATAQLIETEVPGGATGKGRAAIAARLDRLGARLTDHVTVAHRPEAIAEALLGATADLMLILTGSATSDPRDVAPSGVRAAGGEVDHFGMPVDPGNLLFVGRLGDRPVIGLPGCVRSPALNGADWVIERLICGVPVTSGDIMGMGVGGLLKESPARPHPRAGR